MQRRLSDFLEVTLIEEQMSLGSGPFTLNCRKTIHNIPTFAFKIQAAGRLLGYSADTAHDPELIRWLAAADLVIHETGPAGLHTPYEKLAALPPELRAKMRLIHYPDDFDLKNSQIEPLQQGRCYVV